MSTTSVQQARTSRQAPPIPMHPLTKALGPSEEEMEMARQILRERREEEQEEANAAKEPTQPGLPSELRGEFHNAINEVNREINKARILTVMLTDGEARDCLSDADANDLDWVLRSHIEAAVAAIDEVCAVVLAGGRA